MVVRWVLSLAGLVVALAVFSRVATGVENRQGVVLVDPVLDLLPSIDLTWPIFAIIYGGLLAALWILRRRPDRLLHLVRAYTLLLLVRCITLWVTPLDPPTDMIVLVDPVAGLGPGGALTRDLFFSGHTATFMLLTLAMVGPWRRRIFALGTIVLAVMLLLQHVHYTIDVVVAPFVAVGCWWAIHSVSAE